MSLDAGQLALSLSQITGHIHFGPNTNLGYLDGIVWLELFLDGGFDLVWCWCISKKFKPSTSGSVGESCHDGFLLRGRLPTC